jgi:hypothetical protein
MSLGGRGAYFAFFYIISDVEREEAWRGGLYAYNTFRSR